MSAIFMAHNFGDIRCNAMVYGLMSSYFYCYMYDHKLVTIPDPVICVVLSAEFAAMSDARFFYVDGISMQ